MPLNSYFEKCLPKIIEWRHDLHKNPELQFETHRTSNLVASYLRGFGCDSVTEGIGRTGVVGVIKGRSDTSGRVIALRADMDALPILETVGLDYASKIDGAMHACGHDGHTAMLLGATQYLSETRNFDGTCVVVFQPAEEGGGGGREMCDDGLMDRWNIQEIYGMHNWPGNAVGDFSIRSGPFFASTDRFDIQIKGKGGHAARPNEAVDPVVIASQVVVGLQTIASRAVDPVKQVVVTVADISTDNKAYNVIPEVVYLKGTIRTIGEGVRDFAMERIAEIATGIAISFRGTAVVDFLAGYPMMVNHKEQTDHAKMAARAVTGECVEAPLIMAAEDFSYMLEHRPGAYILLGNGDSSPLHHPRYDFNDSVIPFGCSWWAKIVELRMPLPSASKCS